MQIKKIFAGLVLCLAATIGHAQEGITVFAAASLTNALTEASVQYEWERGIHITHSFASSSTLARQIESGAPADLFISANAKWMDFLQARKLIVPASRRNWLSNRLVLIVPKGHRFAVRFEPDFNFAGAFEGHLCTGDTESVPAGIYARQSLMHLGWWAHIKSRIVGTPDVRGALAFVERGECAAGIVYESDALISDKVEITGVFPEESHTPIVYPMAFVAGARNMDQEYWAYLQSPAAEAIFAKYGFRILK